MAAPEYVPVKPIDDVRTYESPPRRPDPWLAQRPGDFVGHNPRGVLFGDPGPDQGYALGLAKLLADKVRLQSGEGLDDAVAGCVAVALRRASLFGRAPIIHDLTAAYTVWGFFDASPPVELLAVRKAAFDQVAIPAHYSERRRIVAAVREDALRRAPAKIATDHAADWRSLIDVDVLTAVHD